MHHNMKPIVLFISFFMFSCSNTKESIITDDTDSPGLIWDIPIENLKEGAPYALVTEPEFTTVGELNLGDNEEVVIIKGEEGIKVYPLRYVNFSEVVNDVIDGTPIAITNCPQTKSSICFIREFQEEVLNLKASGYLYNDNQVYSNDEETIFWSQMLLEKIRGQNKYKLVKTYPSLKTIWSTVKEFFPDANVYFREESRVESNSKGNKSIENIVLGIIDDSRFENELYLFDKNEIGMHKKVSIQSSETLIYNNTDFKIATAFKLPTNHVEYTHLFPNIFTDNENNTWDIFGFCTSGNRLGDRLEAHIFYEAEDWAWKLFFENINYDN